MKANQKPPCEAFVVQAIKQLRQRPPNIVPPTAYAGASMTSVYKIALAYYSPKSVERALNRLIRNGTVIAVQTGGLNEGPYKINRLMSGTDSCIAKALHGWPLNANGEVEHERGLAVSFRCFPSLYLSADDIPTRLIKAFEVAARKKKIPEPRVKRVKKKTKAELIMENTILALGNKK